MRQVEGAKVYRLFYPTVPAIVAAAAPRGDKRVSAMPVVSIISLSNDPALVGIASSPSHATYRMIIESGCLSVSWLDRRFTGAVHMMGTTSGEEGGGGGSTAIIRDKLTEAGLHYRIGEEPRVPIIDEAAAVLECTLAGRERFGDHDLLVAEVKKASAIEDFAGYWAFRDYNPILYAGIRDGFDTYPP